MKEARAGWERAPTHRDDAAMDGAPERLGLVAIGRVGTRPKKREGWGTRTVVVG